MIDIHYKKLILLNLLGMILGNAAAFFMMPSLYIFRNQPGMQTLLMGGLPTVIVYIFMYNNAWQEGWRDVNRVKLGQVPYNPYKGLICSAINVAPAFLTWLLYIILHNHTASTILRIFNFYTAGYYFAFPNWLALITILLFTGCLLFGFVGYILGYKGFSIYQNTAYDKKKHR